MSNIKHNHELKDVTNTFNGPIMDILDDWVFGPLDIIDRIGWVIWVIRKRSFGHRFKLVRLDKWNGDTNPLSFNECQQLLKDRGILTGGYTHDATYMYFSVSHRQAQWAEYILLRAGVGEQLCNPTKQKRKNEARASGHSGPPPAWKDQPKNTTRKRSSKPTPAPKRRKQAGAPATPVKPTQSGVDGLIDKLFG